MSEALQQLSPSEQAEFMQHMEQSQQLNSLLTYNKLVHKCFDQCATTFKSKRLEDSEVKCIENCADKFIKLTQRVGYRFQEHQASGIASAQQSS
jgi:mitochondrial import inner membrane translocase subunit TIM9